VSRGEVGPRDVLGGSTVCWLTPSTSASWRVDMRFIITRELAGAVDAEPEDLARLVLAVLFVRKVGLRLPDLSRTCRAQDYPDYTIALEKLEAPEVPQDIAEDEVRAQTQESTTRKPSAAGRRCIDSPPRGADFRAVRLVLCWRGRTRGLAPVDGRAATWRNSYPYAEFTRRTEWADRSQPPPRASCRGRAGGCDHRHRRADRDPVRALLRTRPAHGRRSPARGHGVPGEGRAMTSGTRGESALDRGANAPPAPFAFRAAALLVPRGAPSASPRATP
jgi:hypothetical protein